MVAHGLQPSVLWVRAFHRDLAAWSVWRWAGPFRGDDLVELLAYPLSFGGPQDAEIIQETGRVFPPRCMVGDRRRHRFHLRDCHLSRGQALMDCRSSLLREMEIFLGFAASATGISSVSTPLS